MQVKINYGHIGRTQFLEEKIKKEMKKISSKMKFEDSARYDVWIDELNSEFASAGEADFKFAVNLRVHGKDFYVKKHGPDFHHCLVEAKHALEKKLRRDGKKYLARRSHRAAATM